MLFEKSINSLTAALKQRRIHCWKVRKYTFWSSASFTFWLALIQLPSDTMAASEASCTVHPSRCTNAGCRSFSSMRGTFTSEVLERIVARSSSWSSAIKMNNVFSGGSSSSFSNLLAVSVRIFSAIQIMAILYSPS